MRQPGSRLKTPNYPIWITSCAGHYGVIFNRNPDLLRNYHAEACFDVFYYSCSGHQIQMTIDNRAHNDSASSMLERQPSSAESSSLSGRSASDDQKATGNNTGQDEASVNTPMQKLIHTKWEEAQIRYHVQTSQLSYLFSTH